MKHRLQGDKKTLASDGRKAAAISAALPWMLAQSSQTGNFMRNYGMGTTPFPP